MNNTILKSWNGEWPEVRSSTPLPTGEGVIDQGTFNTIEIDELFDNMNYASTMVGQSTLYRSLTHPSAELLEVEAKQQALKELENNPELLAHIERIVNNAARDEQGLYQLLYGKFLGMLGTSREKNEVEGYGYAPYIRGTRLFTSLVSEVQHLELPKSSYLNGLFEKINQFSETREYALMKGPVYKTEQRILSKPEKSPFYPALIFKPRVFKPLFIGLVFTALWLVSYFNPFQDMGVSFAFSPNSVLLFAPLALLYIPTIGSYDRDSCILPLRDEFKNSEAVQNTLDVLGQLDELLALRKYSQEYGGSMILPELLDIPHHQIELTAVKNPVLGKANPDYVGNNFSLTDERLVFVSGPNSGGKTAFCKTITQVQLLTQIGSYIPAESAKLTVADSIFYQVPEISHLDDGEGRFGTELKRTKNIFLASTERSLVVLDELSEGTTHEEKIETSSNILEGFYEKGNNTILITHNHELVDIFKKRRMGLAKQVEFFNEEPTYKLIDGISRVSHADRVAKKIGFSKEDIKNYLKAGK